MTNLQYLEQKKNPNFWITLIGKVMQKVSRLLTIKQLEEFEKLVKDNFVDTSDEDVIEGKSSLYD